MQPFILMLCVCVCVCVCVWSAVRLFSNEEDVALLGEKGKYPKPHKVDLLSCLGFAGKWVTSHPDLQVGIGY